MVRPCEADLEENIKVHVLFLLTYLNGMIVDRTKVRAPTTLVIIIGLLSPKISNHFCCFAGMKCCVIETTSFPLEILHSVN